MNRLPLLNEGVGSYQGIGDTYVQSRLGWHSTYSFSMTALKWSEGENYVALSPYGIRLPGLRYPNGHRRIDRRISVCEAATAGRTSLGSRLDRRQQLDPNCRRDLCTVVQIDRKRDFRCTLTPTRWLASDQRLEAYCVRRLRLWRS